MLRRSRVLLVACVAAALPVAARAQQAIHPIIDLKGEYLLGARVNGTWRTGEQLAPRLRAGLRYRVFDPTREVGVSRGARAVSFDVPCAETFGVALTPKPAGGEIAISAPWAVVPRRVTRLSAAAAAGYNNAVREIVARHGIRNPVPRVTGAVRADLDGDGTEEVIISAYRDTGGGGMNVGAGDYSLLFVRKLVNGIVRTIILEEEYHPRAKGETTPNQYSIAGVYDLDGDGTSEIVIRGQYYEGGWTTVYGLRGTTKRELVRAGCGV
jgi:hypothetical protein